VQEATGDGPVDAAFKVIESATGVQATLRKFEVRSVTMGEDAQGEAVVTVEHNGRSYRASSVTTDIVESGVRAFLEVVNQIEATRATAARAENRNPEAQEAASIV
jgi:2-isopropylmalate synthase